MSARESLKERWDNIDPKVRLRLVGLLAVAGVFIIAISVVGGGGATKRGPAQAGRVENVLNAADGTPLGVDGVTVELREMETRLREVEAENEKMRRSIETGAPGAASLDRRLEAELAAMRRQMDELAQRQTEAPARSQGPEQRATDPRVGAHVPNGPVDASLSPQALSPPAYGTIRTIEAQPEAAPKPQSTPTRSSTSKDKEEGLYLPATTMIQAVLLSGVDAPSGSSGSRDPMPVLARLKHQAILPNRFKAEVEDCNILLEARGSLSDERAHMRSTTLACTRRDRSIIELPLSGYAIGEDGRAGVRGIVVNKQSRVIGYALLAGMAEGASMAIGGNRNNTSLGGAASELNFSQAGTTGVGRGTSSALDRIAQWYIDQANELMPIVEIDSGRPVVIVLLKGVSMAPLVAPRVTSRSN